MGKQQWLPVIPLLMLSTAGFGFGAAKGVDGFKVIDHARYQVFSQRGQGSFNLLARQNTHYSVCFFYRDQERIGKLQSVDINVMTDSSDQQVTDFTIQNGCVQFRSDTQQDLPLQIEFSDIAR